MKPLLRIIRLLVRSERRAVALGLALSVIVLVMGAALLGLSGWFITAAAAAGLAGIGVLFNVFLPSAMVRFLALGRTAARYGERLATHDAVLRALSVLRLRLLRGFLARPFREVERLRAASALNRITADVDALDGALLRLVLPGLAGGITVVVATMILWWLVHPAIALGLALGYLVVPNVVFLIGQHRARKPSRQAEAAMQALRIRLVELILARDDLTVYGEIPAAEAACETAVARHETARHQLGRVERAAGFGLDLTSASVTAGALGLGAALAQAGRIDAATAAIGVFVALALTEAIAPVRRALTEIGGMIQAARRVEPALAVPTPPHVPSEPDMASGLQLDSVVYRPSAGRAALFAPVSAQVAPGEMLALTGPSGVGKSTVLLMAAGALVPDSGRISLGGSDVALLPPAVLHRHLVMVPQRNGLVAGTVAENLRLAAPEAEDAALWRVLETVCLAQTVRSKGGLEARLGQRGAGLSGGEARRLVLARALLRDPDVLLLDEPTEGLDSATAERVMVGLRAALPRAAILVAAHRKTERDAADKVLDIRSDGI